MEKEKDTLFSQFLSAGTRVYYFDAKVDVNGNLYMALSEIPTDKASKLKKRQRLFVPQCKIDAYVEAINKVAEFIKSQENDKANKV